jgi:hypothetical protein
MSSFEAEFRRPTMSRPGSPARFELRVGSLALAEIADESLERFLESAGNSFIQKELAPEVGFALPSVVFERK